MNRKKLRAVLGAVFILYSIMLCYFLFFADYYGRSFNLFHPGYFDNLKEYISQNINFCPFATVFLYVRGYLSGAVSIYPLAVNLIGNLVAFMPLGFFVPYFFKRLRKPVSFLVFMVLLVVVVELLQLVMMTGVCDIDDLILNVIGAFIIYLLSKKVLLK